MSLKVVCFILGLVFCSASFADKPLGQTLQVNTHFNSILGKPTWLLTIRDMQTGQILPYLFDIKNNDNFWIAFTAGRSYRVTISNLQFGPYAKIKNFCHLENGILTGKSMWIMLSGELSPDSHRFKCEVMKYQDATFPIVNNR